MLEIIVLVLGLLCLFLLLLLFLQHKNVRCIREQLTYTNREHSTFRFYSASMDPQMKHYARKCRSCGNIICRKV